MPDEPIRHILKRLKSLPSDGYDVLEVGIKSVTEASLSLMRKLTVLPIMVAARGGKLTAKRVRLYEQAVRCGWDWIDVDMQSSEKLLKDLLKKLEKAHHRKSRAKLILSVHDSVFTTSTRMIEEWIETARMLGKNIPTLPKVVVKIVEFKDILRIRKIAMSYSKKNIAIILHGQGDYSRESRLLQAAAGSAIAYLSLRDSLATAKGQWTITDWNRTIREQPKPTTRKP